MFRRPTLGIALVLAASGCGPSQTDDTTASGLGGGGSSGHGHPSASATTSSASAGGGEGGSAQGGQGGCMFGTNVHKVAIHELDVPSSMGDHALDLNGDGNGDNGYGKMIAALGAAGVDVQGECDSALALGFGINLVELTSSDPAFQSDACAMTMLYAGSAAGKPDFSGGGTFSIDANVIPAMFVGPLSGGEFRSDPEPAKATQPIGRKLRLCFGAQPVLVPVTGLSIRYTVQGAGLEVGTLGGAIRKEDVESILLPALATSYTSFIVDKPNSVQSQKLRELFDVGNGNGGKCIQPDTDEGIKNDGIVAPCELAASSFIQANLTLDVDLFDEAGAWAPNAGNASKDSLSFGFGFSAAAAKY